MDTLYWFVERPDDANREDGTRGSLFYHDRFYDNVRFDLHGYNPVRFPKKSYDIDFNNENRFYWQEGELPVRDMNLISNEIENAEARRTHSYRSSRSPVFSVPLCFNLTCATFEHGDTSEQQR